MANRKDLAKSDGLYKNNAAQIERGDFLVPGYEAVPLSDREISSTGHHRVLRIASLNEAEGPRLLGRWDEKDQLLDFDLVDAEDRVQKVMPHGHHAKALGDWRFEVEVGPDADTIIFKGVVSIAFGTRRRRGGSGACYGEGTANVSSSGLSPVRLVRAMAGSRKRAWDPLHRVQ